MDWIRSFISRCTGLLRKQNPDLDFDEELRTHIELAVEENLKRGMPEEEAQRLALCSLGGITQTKEAYREQRGFPLLEAAARDLRYAARRLTQAPRYTILAVITLALGIGASTAIFTLVQQVMLRSLPVAKPKQLWRIGDSNDCCHSNGYTQNNENAQNDWSLFSWRTYQLFKANTPAFQNLAAFELGEANAELAVRRWGSAAPLAFRNGEYVSGNFFETFGVSAWRGRLFTEADDREGAPPVAVMSFHTWLEKYGANPSVVGATFEINGHAFTVVGIAPPGFYGAKIATSGMPDFWFPLSTEPMMAGATSQLKDPALAWLALIGRVKPGTNLRALQAQLQGELHAWLASNVTNMDAREKLLWSRQTLRLTPGEAGVSLMRARYQGSLWLMFAAALCLLLLANANLANLLLARGLRDRHQIAVKVAMGCSRGRLIRQALVESLLLALLGGVAGVLVAWAATRLILYLAMTQSAQSSWIPLQAAPSQPMLLFAVGISLLSGIIFGIVPAWIASHAKPIDAMRGVGRSAGNHASWLQKSLVVAQVAMSLILLSTAMLLGQSVRNHERQNLGFDPNGRYLVSIDSKLSNYTVDQLNPLFQEIETRLRAIPGVRSVGAVLEAPPAGWLTHNILIEGQPQPGPRADILSGWTRVTPGFFPTYGDRILAGRAITDEDTATTRPVAVVNEAFVKKFFGRKNPIEQHFGPAPEQNAKMYEIVGVASDLTFEGNQDEPMYFLPESQSTTFTNAINESREVWSHYLYNLVIWAPQNPAGLEKQVKAALAKVNPDLIVYGVQSYADVIRVDTAQSAMVATLTLLFALVGLVLAAVGLYGVTAYGVEQRRTEIGVRMALGADRGRVIKMVLRGAFLQVGVGLALGIPIAVGAGYLIASQLFGVKPWDFGLLGCTVLLLGAAALVASWIPARRAAGIDPIEALRAD